MSGLLLNLMRERYLSARISEPLANKDLQYTARWVIEGVDHIDADRKTGKFNHIVPFRSKERV